MAKGRAVAIVLDDGEKHALTAMTRRHGAPQAIAERARIALATVSGLRNKEIAETLGVCAHGRSLAEPFCRCADGWSVRR